MNNKNKKTMIIIGENAFIQHLPKKVFVSFDKALSMMNEALSFVMDETPTDYEILESLVGSGKANKITDMIIKLNKKEL